MKLAFFYDQSEIVRASVGSVWEAILFGLILSVVILYFFLKNWGTTLVATLVIPVTVLITLLAMKIAGRRSTMIWSIAAIGLVIDDAIVVGAIHTKRTAEVMPGGHPDRHRGDPPPLVSSDPTPSSCSSPRSRRTTGVFFRLWP
jgi:multidrug efflux pump subunit AcrB